MLVALVFLAVLAASSAQELSFNGRFEPPHSDGVFPQRMTWASTSVFVPFQGSGNVTVSLSQVPQTGPSKFELRVDGKLVNSATTNSSVPVNVTLPIMGGGVHQLTITKITEAALGEAFLEGVYLDGPSFAGRRSTLVNRRMEVIGASVVNGYGIMGTTFACNPPYLAEDSVLAFGPLVANHFGARFAQIAWSGAGLMTPAKSGNGAVGPTILELYNRTVPTDASAKWDFSSFVPEVVLLEAGGNDFNDGSAPSNWTDVYKAFLNQIRGNAPNAEIVVVGLPDNVVSTIRSPEAAQAYSGNVTSAIRELKDSGFQRLNFLGLPPSVKQGGTGCAGHPSADTHSRIADMLQNFVANLTGWTPISTESSYGSFVYNN